MTNLNSQLRHNPIAIIGMGSIFPKARNLREFWSNIVGKADCITDVPESHWKIDDYYDPDPTAPDKTYCKRGGFLPEVDFDPMEFGLPPNILEVTDVSQMLSLVVAKEALNDAGYLNTTAEVRDRTGIVLGVGGGQKLIVPLSSRLQYPVWKKALLASGISEADADKIIEKIKLAYIGWEENSFPGMLGNVIAGRIANRFDLGGINCVTDAACASSMSALKLAISELLENRSDLMITGGVDTDNSIVMFMNFSKTPAFTRGTHPRPFDTQSDGMMVGEGIGMMVLKRLADAERDGDKIYAVIKGIGASSDGRFKSIYAPRGEGQEKALKRAYEDAGFSAATVGLFEAHGTGTVAGDNTEVTTAIRYLNAVDERKQHIAIGSVKSQIGHAKAAAGIAGLIKTALALHHKVLPATINVTEPNPKFDFENSAFYVSTETRPWNREGDTPRRAGVSSFGFGGTNFHVVMEEYQPEHSKTYRLQNTSQAFLMHAATPAQLLARVKDSLVHLQSAESEAYFLNYAQEFNGEKLQPQEARLGFVAENAQELITMLTAAAGLLESKINEDEWHHPKGIYYRKSGLDVRGRVAALFSGQGSQYLNMGRELALNFPEVRESFGGIDHALTRNGQRSLSNIVYPAPAFNEEEHKRQEAAIQSTAYAQPAIGALSSGLYRLFKRAGFRPDFTAGHSFGEVSALWAAGVISDEDYYELVRVRGAAMAPPPQGNGFDPGTMIAVTGDINAIKQEVDHIDGVQVANHNSQTQVVLAGGTQAVKHAEEHLKSKGYRVVQLAVSAAFHTPLVGHARNPFADAINKVTFHLPQVPVYSNATGKAYPTDPTIMKQMLSDHVLNAVLFKDEIENLYAAGAYVFVEFGPRNVLTNLVKDILAGKPHIAIALNGSRQKDSDRQMREAVVQLQVIGVEFGVVDPYTVPQEIPTPGKKKMTVKLNGANYVSQKTQDAYQNALTDGFSVSGGGTQIVEKIVEVEKVVEKIVEVEKPVPVTASVPVMTPSPASARVDAGTTLSALERRLEDFRTHQQEVQRVQEIHLQNQAEYLRIFFELTSQQSTVGDAQTAALITQSMMRFHDMHEETLRLHEQYMRDQAATTQEHLSLIRQHYGALAISHSNGDKPTPPNNGGGLPVVTFPPAPVAVSAPAPVVAVSAPVPVAPAPAVSSGVDVAALSSAMLRIVSDKTGYPSDMLDLSMDMEADLGIDSIKRVEILGAMRDEFPNLPQFSPEELAELRTLGEIVDFMNNAGGGSSSAPAVATPAPVIATPAPAPVVAVSAPVPVAPAPVVSSGVDVAALSSAMLRIVSDKTGYPSDMLDLSMDMEADLGIDSIKRVEILGAMRDEFPNLPQFSPEELAELRTLGEIVDFMNNAGGGGSAPAVATPAPAPVVAVSAPAPVVPSGVDVAALSSAMLRIVSDKTGYPSDMLDLSMDMEADLGIDSIKRVEILGAMRDEFPNLPQFSPEELAELRTLGEIVDFMNNAGGGSSAPVAVTPAPVVAVSTPVPVASAPVVSSGVDVAALSSAMLRIVSDKTGYPSDMLDLSMDMEADLGIDSIKRVEILGAMRDEFPNLPQFSPEELAELRTLGEIVDFMNNAGGGGSAPAVATPAPAPVVAVSAPVPVAPAPVVSSGVDVAALSSAMLRIVSDKTGYPSDMLDLSMDMEADLGIDSIKRVEILGAMRDEFPNLPQFSPEELAELRTLGEIVDFMNNAGGGSSSAPAPVAVGAPTPAQTNVARIDPKAHGIERSVVQLSRIPTPDYMDIGQPDGVIIVTDDGTPATSAVVSALTERGWQVAVIGLPSNIVATQTSVNVARVNLPNTDESSLQQAVESLKAQYGAISGFILLAPNANLTNGSLFVEREKELVKYAFFMAKHLKTALTSGATTRRSFVTVTRLDGALGLSNDAAYGTIASGLTGLIKTLNLEWNGAVFCRAIDVQPATTAESVAQIVVAELHDPNQLISEVAYGSQGRVTLVAREMHTNGVN